MQRKLVIIEPNLTPSFGHATEFTKNIVEASQGFNLEPHVIIKNGIKVKQEQIGTRNILDILNNKVFDFLEDNGIIFQEDLTNVFKELELNRDDIIFVQTGYTNEIQGAYKFFQERGLETPSIAIWLHQLYPPEPDFIQSTEPLKKLKWETKLQNALNFTSNKVKVFITVSNEFNKYLNKISRQEIRELPFPYSMPKPPRRKKGGITFSFLGDSRFEKGLLLLLEVLEKKEFKSNFVIQIINPRGYSKSDSKRLDKLIRGLETRKNITFIKGGLYANKFQTELSKSSVVILPYHPDSYDKRVSGLLVQSILFSKPVIVSSDTWLSDEIQRLNTGIVFEYDRLLEEQTQESLYTSIEKMEENFEFYAKKAEEVSKEYSVIHSGRNFVSKLISSI